MVPYPFLSVFINGIMYLAAGGGWHFADPPDVAVTIHINSKSFLVLFFKKELLPSYFSANAAFSGPSQGS
jgi:hypothetical protein